MANCEGFMPEVQKVVNAHKNDFYYKNYSSKMKGYGGYGTYVNNLSPFFKEVRARINKGQKVTTIQQFQRRANYVSGLMAIWGFDYNNSKTYWRWGHSTESTSDSFYTGGKRGKCNSGTIGNLCQGTNGKARTTCCNYGVDTLYKACNRYKMSSSFFKRIVNQGKGTVVTSRKKIKVGDMILFFHASIDYKKKGTWKGWSHVAIVYKITDKYIILADYGSRFIKSKKPFHYMDRKSVESSGKAGGAYSNYGKNWAAIHMFDLKNEPEPITPITEGTPEEIEGLDTNENETSDAISDIPMELDSENNTATQDESVPVEEIDYQKQPWKISMPRLTKGSKGKAVKIWQIIANNSSTETKAKIDGDFGINTQAASKSFQQNNGLSVDGVIDTKEWEQGLYLMSAEYTSSEDIEEDSSEDINDNEPEENETETTEESTEEESTDATVDE